MHKNRMLRESGSMICVNLDSWIRSPRTIQMILFTLATAYLTTRSYGKSITYLGYLMNFSESMAYIFMTGFNGIALSSLTFLVMISEIPRRIPFQQYTIIRSSRLKWIGAQLLYCVLLVFVMLLVLSIVFSAFVIQYTTAGEGWSDDLRISEGMEAELALIPAWVRTNFSPWQAFALSIIPIFLFWLVMVLTVMLCSLLGKPTIGISLFAIILFSSIIFYFESIQGFEPPMTFTTLLKIVYQYENAYIHRLLSVFACYIAIIGGLVFSIIIVAKNMDMPIYALNKN